MMNLFLRHSRNSSTPRNPATAGHAVNGPGTAAVPAATGRAPGSARRSTAPRHAERPAWSARAASNDAAGRRRAPADDAARNAGAAAGIPRRTADCEHDRTATTDGVGSTAWHPGIPWFGTSADEVKMKIKNSGKLFCESKQGF